MVLGLNKTQSAVLRTTGFLSGVDIMFGSPVARGVGTALGNVVGLGIRGGVALANIGTDVVSVVENVASNNRNKPLKRIESMNANQLKELEQNINGLSISDFSKYESRKRKLRNKTK